MTRTNKCRRAAAIISDPSLRTETVLLRIRQNLAESLLGIAPNHIPDAISELLHRE
jgi:hypothetical protein